MTPPRGRITSRSVGVRPAVSLPTSAAEVDDRHDPATTTLGRLRDEATATWLRLPLDVDKAGLQVDITDEQTRHGWPQQVGTRGCPCVAAEFGLSKRSRPSVATLSPG